MTSRRGIAKNTSVCQPTREILGGVVGAMSRSLCEAPRDNHRTESTSYAPNLCPVYHFQITNIWFGSYQANGVKDRNWSVSMKYRRDQNFWEFEVSCQEDLKFVLRQQDIKEISICGTSSAMLMIILPTVPFAADVTRRLSLDPNDNHHFDPYFRTKAAKRIVLDFSSRNSDCFDFTARDALNLLLGHPKSGFKCLEEMEVAETLKAQREAEDEIGRIKAGKESLLDVVPAVLGLKMRLFKAKIIAIGGYSAEDGVVMLNPEKGIVRVFSQPLLTQSKDGFFGFTKSDIDYCYYMKTANLVIFRLIDSWLLPLHKLDDSAVGFTHGGKFSRTKVSLSTHNLRILFTNFNDLEQYLDCFKLVKHTLSKNLLAEAFPEYKPKGPSDTTIVSSVGAGAASSKPGLTGKPNPGVFDFFNGSQSSNSTRNTGLTQGVGRTTGPNVAQKSGSVSILTRPTMPHKRFPNDTNVQPAMPAKKSRPEEIVEVDENSDHDSVVPVISGPTSRPVDRREKKTQETTVLPAAPSSPVREPNFPAMSSILDVWEAKVAARNARRSDEAKPEKAEANDTDKSPKTVDPTSTAMTAASSSDPIVLEDSSDDEGDPTEVREPDGTSYAALPEYELPDDCHEIYRSIHSFPEVILGNASVRDGDIYQLTKGQQLGDGIVQFMLEFVRLSMNEEDVREIHFMSYFFFQTFLGSVRNVDYEKGNTLPDKVMRRLNHHIKNVKIFDFKYVVFPILYDQHWYLVIICHPDPRKEFCEGRTCKPIMLVIDSLHSLGSKERHNFTCDLLGRWLECLYVNACGKPYGFMDAKVCKRVVAKSPQQTNGVDCGVFMYNALVYFIRDKYRFANLGQKPGPIPKPSLEKWFPLDDIAIEKSRLMMLHSYYTVAAISMLTVYRDTYIPGLIRDMDNKTRPSPFSAEEDEIVINSSPAKQSSKISQSNSLVADVYGLSAMTIKSHADDKLPVTSVGHQITNGHSDSARIPGNYLPTPVFRLPASVTDQEREYYSLIGLPVPAVGEATKKPDGEEKLRRFLALREQEKAGVVQRDVTWEPHFVPGRTAASITAEFVSWKGDNVGQNAPQ